MCSLKLGLPDGREAVYDNDGNLVTDPRYKGTYNYANPDGADGKWDHLVLDVLPWLFFGEQG